MKRNYCWTIAVFTIICSVVFLVSMSFAGTESTEIVTLRDALRDETTAVTIEMGVLRDLQNEMWRLKSTWDSTQRDLRELGINKLNNMAQLDVVNTIVRMWNTPEQTTRQIDYARSLNSYMQEAIDMVQTQLLYTDCAVDMYDMAWAELFVAVSGHNSNHGSPSETDHSTPAFVSNWKYRTDFPSFLCAGDCNESFDTPVSPHDKKCGENDDASVAGCGKKYFTCVSDKNDRHQVRTCGKWVWRATDPPPGVLPARIRDHVCSVKFRNCTNPAAPHYWEWHTKHNEDGTKAEQEYAAQQASLSPSSGSSYTASAGSTHTASVNVPSGYNYVYWYLAGPGIDGLGLLQETDTGDGSSTSASFSWSIPSYASGDHVITAYTYLSDGSIVQPSYTLSVGSGSSTDTTTTDTSSTTDDDSSTASTSPYSLSASSTGSPFQPGDTVTLTLSGYESYYSVDWSLESPQYTSSSPLSYDYADGYGSYDSSASYTFPSGYRGNFVFKAVVYTYGNMTRYEHTYTITVE